MNFAGKRNFVKGGESAHRHSLFYAAQILTRLRKPQRSPRVGSLVLVPLTMTLAAVNLIQASTAALSSISERFFRGSNQLYPFWQFCEYLFSEMQKIIKIIDIITILCYNMVKNYLKMTKEES